MTPADWVLFEKFGMAAFLIFYLRVWLQRICTLLTLGYNHL